MGIENHDLLLSAYWILVYYIKYKNDDWFLSILIDPIACWPLHVDVSGTQSVIKWYILINKRKNKYYILFIQSMTITYVTINVYNAFLHNYIEVIYV